MLKRQYRHLNNIQKGAFGEAYAKMAFTLEGFEVFTSECDDRGVDFVVKSPVGKFYSVQVKTTDPVSNPFIYERKFQSSSDFIFLAVRLVENEEPKIYMACGSDWQATRGCLNFNGVGGNAGPYYEISFAKKYAKELESYQFARFALKL